MAATDSTVFPPGPKGAPLLGNVFAFRRDPLGFLESSARAFGDLVHYQFGRVHVVLLAHPEYIKDALVSHQHSFVKGVGIQWAKRFLGEGLLTSEGEFHTRQRRLSQPAFHRQRIGSYGDVMARYAARAREQWQDGAVLDFHAEMMALTLAVASKTLFDADVESESGEIGASLTNVLALFPRFSLPFAGLLDYLPLPSNRRYVKSKQRLDATVYRLIRERRQAGVDRGDLLSMLLLAQDEEGDGGGMNDLQLRDEVMTLLLAGHETTANALTWTFYLLSQNPGAEARLHEELDVVLAGRLPGVDDLPRLSYTERVFAESMRLYPPAWAIGRRAVEDFAVGGYVLPAGTLVSMSTWVTHRDPRWYPDPLTFEPDRWTPEKKAARPKFAYFPFGGGARQCIGESFAWMEGVLLVATLAQRWRMRLAPGQRVAPQPLITLRPRYGMRMTAHRR
jgi:cytochrome P450